MIDVNPNVLLSIFFILLVGSFFYALVRRAQATVADGELNVFEYGQLLLQAYETAKIVVSGIQEAWRTGEITDDEREIDAIEKMVELYPKLNEDDLRRTVKSAVYWLRLSAGKQVDKVIGHIPHVPNTP